MTGRELIIYILENHLEDEPVIKDGKLIGFASVSQIAVTKEIGIASVYALMQEGKIPFQMVTDTIQIPLNSIDDRKE